MVSFKMEVKDVETSRISITEAKQNLGELVRRTAYGGERFILEFRGKPRAAIISYADLRALRTLDSAPVSQAEALEHLSQLRRRIAERDHEPFDSSGELDTLRQERLDDLADLHR